MGLREQRLDEVCVAQIHSVRHSAEPAQQLLPNDKIEDAQSVLRPILKNKRHNLIKSCHMSMEYWNLSITCFKISAVVAKTWHFNEKCFPFFLSFQIFISFFLFF